MSREYVELECGCLASCDAGGGLVPCDGDDCKFWEWKRRHPRCNWCGYCLACHDHDDCPATCRLASAIAQFREAVFNCARRDWECIRAWVRGALDAVRSALWSLWGDSGGDVEW